jgi:hypothetical protein
MKTAAALFHAASFFASTVAFAATTDDVKWINARLSALHRGFSVPGTVLPGADRGLTPRKAWI